ncbi:hypothetical protein [uncultured Maribacter sp.]|uniref:hypothetical protein n=1 Tax=uncultured Maribacter sp. TaxID=431308 RepID=UPI00263871E2|nr:hypothetical protein [uncultured Maribacter sp.]
MKKFNISLEFQGLCIFDPVVLNNFIISNKITTNEVFDYFVKNPKIGKKAINEGVIIPIYSIPELDYKIICSEDSNYIPFEWQLFNIDNFGLKVESNIIIISDIYTIVSWDEPDFFLNYKENYRNKSGSNDYYELDNGLYNINIIGYRETVNKSPFDLEFGYQLMFNKTKKLNVNIDNNDIDEINYNVAPEALL